MDDLMIATHLENLDRRLARVEQILPTLATKGELLETKEELQAAIAPLATKKELLATKEELQAAIAPLATKKELLATKEELQAAIAPLATKDDIHELRRYMDVLSEDSKSDNRLLAEHLSDVMSRLTDR